FGAMHPSEDWIRAKAASTFEPAQVETALLQLGRVWPKDAQPLRKLIEQFPLGEANLLHLLSVSTISATRLVRDPTILLWLNRREVSMSGRDYVEMLGDL